MDKTIEIVVVAMIALLVASILLFLVQDRTTSYSDFLGNQQEGAQCELWISKGQCGEMQGTCTQEQIDECNNPDSSSSETTAQEESTSDDSSTTEDSGDAASPF